MNTENDAPSAYDRDTLYHEVWAEPVRTVAVRYGVSDVALAKACRRLQVPLPGVGYWAKKKVGKAPERAPLPKLSPEEQARLEWATGYRRELRAQQTKPMVAPRPAEETAPKLVVHVEERLVRPHPLVAEARALLRQPGRRVRFPTFPEKPCLDIDVSRGALASALRIMDALLKALEKQGYEVENTAPVRKTPYYNQSELVPGVTRVRVGEEWINFGLTESSTRVEIHVPWDYGKAWGGYSLQYVREGTGEFSLFVSNSPSGFRRTWNDGKKQRVEDCLGAFISYLAVIVEQKRKDRLEAARQNQIWLEEERLRAEARARREEQERRRKELSEMLGHWRVARDIRAFVAEVEQNAGAAGLTEELKERLEWSLQYADSLDPIPGLLAPSDSDEDDEDKEGRNE